MCAQTAHPLAIFMFIHTHTLTPTPPPDAPSGSRVSVCTMLKRSGCCVAHSSNADTDMSWAHAGADACRRERMNATHTPQPFQRTCALRFDHTRVAVVVSSSLPKMACRAWREARIHRTCE